MAISQTQKERAARARNHLTHALRCARGVALYNAVAADQEHATKESLLRAAVAARQGMEDALQRIIDEVRDIADAEKVRS